MSAIEHVTDTNFDDEVLGSDVPVLVDFWADWCGPCKKVAPVLDELSGELGDKVAIKKLDIDANPETVRKYQVMSVPTMILFKGGEAADQIVGAQPKAAIKKFLEK